MSRGGLLSEFLDLNFQDSERQLRDAFAAKLRERKRPDMLPIDSRRRIIFRGTDQPPPGIYVETIAPNGASDVACVIRGPFTVHRQSWVEGRPVIEAEDDIGRFSGDFTAIFTRLTSRGRILYNKLGKDVLAHLISSAPCEEGGWAAFGIYADDKGRLELPPSWSPQTQEQLRYLEAAETAFTFQPTPEDWLAYATLRGVYDPHEAMPSFGAAAIAPVSYVLRDNNRIVPIVVNWSPQHGTGKTALTSAVSRRLWLSQTTSGDGIKTRFRFIAKLESACVPVCVDEAQSIPWDDLGDIAKQAMECSHISGRGTGSTSDLKEYLSRATLLLTSNTLPQIHASTLTRMVLARFRGGHLAEQEPEPWTEELPRKMSGQEFRNLLDRLKPCGFTLARTIVATFPTTQALLERVQRIASDFDICGVPVSWSDARRPQIWATIFLGLQMWERASGGVVSCPTIQEFLVDVVMPSERESRLTERDPLKMLADHIRMFIAKNSMTVYDADSTFGDRVRRTVSRGEDVLYFGGVEKVRDEVVQGWWIGSAMLEDYNRTVAKDPESRFRSLADVSRASAEAEGIDECFWLDPDRERPRQKKWDGKTARMAFIPDRA